MSNEKRDRLLIEKLLGYEYLGSGINDVTYRAPLTAARCTLDMANFFFLLWNRAKGKEWWPEFIDSCTHSYKTGIGGGIEADFEFIVHPDRFADALAEFLEGRK